MRDLALSATATTGLFTLLGAVIGVTITGSLAIIAEILRRRWQRQDTKDDTARQRRAAAIEERKTLYPKFLAKGNELELFIDTTLLANNPKYLVSDEPSARTKVEAAEALAKTWPMASEELRDFTAAKSQVDLIAGDAVKERADEWQSALAKQLVWASYGTRAQDDKTKEPYERLLEAMKAELKDLSMDA
jgi:hypothetical protein